MQLYKRSRTDLSAKGASLVSPKDNKVPRTACARVTWANITSWVMDNGGYVHPALQLVDNAACGCRGVVAVSSISIEEQDEAPLIAVPQFHFHYLWSQEQDEAPLIANFIFTICGRRSRTRPPLLDQDEAPLIAVPQNLYLTSDAAKTLLNIGTSNKVKGQKPTSAATELAVLLAHERKKCSAGFWHPYIESLPDVPPCAWYQSMIPAEQRLDFGAAGQLGLEDHEWEQQLKAVVGNMTYQASFGAAGQLGLEDYQWEQQLKAVVGNMMYQVEAAAGNWSKALELSEADIAWGLAQVMSRAFGSDQAVGLAPCIDLLNHKLGSVRPQPHVFGSDEGAEEEECMWFVTAGQNERLIPLQAGDELYISYVKNCTASMSMLNFGFVPPELFPQRT
eukprot:gene20860-27697_t